MAIDPAALPVSGLGDLPNESRVISTPWSRLVRGIGLGQYPIDYDSVTAGYIRQTFDHLAAKVAPSNSYTLFCRALADLVLNVENPDGTFDRADAEQALRPLLEIARAERNPYYRVMAGCLLIDAFAKLGQDRALLVNDDLDLPAEILVMADDIGRDMAKDDKQGRHGAYEQVAAYSAIFLALGQLGLKDRLVSGQRNYVTEALDLLENIHAPFFRGRGGSMLLSVISLLGYETFIFDGTRDYMKETLHCLARADELDIFPSFPQEITVSWAKVYPLLTMLNAIAVSGRAEYLTCAKDWLAEAKELLAETPPVERSHMSQYYIVALHNLGRLSDQVPDLDAYVAQVVAQLDVADPGADFFTNGIAYPYIFETAMMTGRMDLIPENALDRMVDSFPDLDRTDVDRINRPFPVSYALNVLGEIGAADRIFAPRARYGGTSAMGWVVDHLSTGAVEEGTRLYMIDHALVSFALRMRGASASETELFASFRFRLSAREDGLPVSSRD
jgi:hypothetical protein